MYKCTERVHGKGGGSGQLRIYAGGATNLFVTKSHRKRVSKLKIATYNARTLLRDEPIRELRSEVRRPEESFTALQSGHPLCHPKGTFQNGLFGNLVL